MNHDDIWVVSNGAGILRGSAGCGEGDVNQDSQIDSLDVVLMVSTIIDGAALSPDQFCASDLNSDGAVNIVDVVMLVSAISE